MRINNCTFQRDKIKLNEVLTAYITYVRKHLIDMVIF